MSGRIIYVGAYTGEDEEGITAFQLQNDGGKLKRLHGIAGIANPSFLTLNADRTRLYAVSEAPDGDGYIASFAINSKDGELTLLNKQSSRGSAPCHVTLDGEEQYLVVTNYSGGNVVLYPVEVDGTVGAAAQIIAHSGQGPRHDRQEKAHPHSSIMSPDNEYVIVADLGIDKLVHYRLDRKAGKLIFHRETEVLPGAGPRHLVYHPNGEVLYALNELDSTIAVYNYAAADSTLESIQTITALPESFHGENTSADIHLTSCGRFLYASNRGHDSIAVFRVDAVGLLALIEHVPSGGRIPRNFALTADDQFLLAANQDSHSIVVYAVHSETGQLLDLEHNLNIESPVCIRFL